MQETPPFPKDKNLNQESVERRTEGKNLKKCGLCGEEIKEGKYFTIYQCKGAESRLVLIACAKDFNDEKYQEIIVKISSI
jgi:hypothetical protein